VSTGGAPGQISRNQMVGIAVLVVALVAVLAFQLRGANGPVDRGVGAADATTTTTASDPPSTWTLPSDPRDPFTGVSPSTVTTEPSTSTSLVEP
jgi:hypothetical protein